MQKLAHLLDNVIKSDIGSGVVDYDLQVAITSSDQHRRYLPDNGNALATSAYRLPIVDCRRANFTSECGGSPWNHSTRWLPIASPAKLAAGRATQLAGTAGVAIGAARMLELRMSEATFRRYDRFGTKPFVRADKQAIARCGCMT